ncbi:hypothetical protein [Corallococcus caeni]|uniref:Uncharacterized protein n=1 Tax=Corallococcus caeni TaxID=3082388 RepID=A0ABQ6QKI7_9BACT|nr:hypothetical protein ASNO1_07780 [Corallococcus sp. NO1]
MRTFGLAVRAIDLSQQKSVEHVFEKTVDEWRVTKLSDPRSIAQGFSLTRNRDIKKGDTRLIEYLADQRADHEGRWRTLVRMFQKGAEHAWLTFEMTLDDIAERFAPAMYNVQPPRLLRNLGKLLTIKTVDGWDVPVSALAVADQSSVEDLAREILDPKRIVPLVVVTEPVYTKPAVRDLGRLLGEHVFGLARVVHVGPKLTFTLTARLGKELSVFDGGVRIYWPGVDPDASPQRHPLITRHAIERAEGSPKRWILEEVSRKLIPVATARYREPEAIRNLLQAIESEKLEEAQFSQLELTEKIRTAIRERDDALDLEQAAFAELRKADLEKKDFEAALFDARRERDKWRALYDSLRLKAEARGEHLPPPPQDENEALEQARKSFKETLLLPTDLTIETDLGPDVYDALNAMHEVVLRERSRKMGDRQKAFADAFGKHLNHPARYEPGATGLYYQKEECRHRVHIKSGKPQDTESIYWLEQGEPDKRKYLIFRIGRHAP